MNSLTQLWCLLEARSIQNHLYRESPRRFYASSSASKVLCRWQCRSGKSPVCIAYLPIRYWSFSPLGPLFYQNLIRRRSWNVSDSRRHQCSLGCFGLPGLPKNQFQQPLFGNAPWHLPKAVFHRVRHKWPRAPYPKAWAIAAFRYSHWPRSTIFS